MKPNYKYENIKENRSLKLVYASPSTKILKSGKMFFRNSNSIIGNI